MIRLQEPLTIDEHIDCPSLSRCKVKRFSSLTSLVVAAGLVLAATSMQVSARVETSQNTPLSTNAAVWMQSAEIADDYDGDGIRNRDDRDDDNDGIIDSVEGRIDEDGDGIPDESSADTDGDGVPDALDLDSDNDGILDNVEARSITGDAQDLDQSLSGSIDAHLSVGENGIADVIETFPDSNVLKFALPDTDGDGTPDFRDLDSDNDNIYDLIEAGGVDHNSDGRIDGFSDQDATGVDDVLQTRLLPLFDTDGDGVVDYRDLDSDGDSITDELEGGGSPGLPTDSDGDGEPDFRETDSDADGVSDRREVGPDPANPADSDGDGVKDYQDADVQSFASDEVSDEGADDGADDGSSVSVNTPDTDGDGIADRDDLDDDNDGIPDFDEGLFTAGGTGEAAPGSLDTDGDGILDASDLDSDNDGIADLVEAGGQDVDNDGRIDDFSDQDNNGFDDSVQANGLPLFDTDLDGLRDFQDLDSDNDGLPDSVESAGDFATPTDSDGDGAPDYREQDSDNDGVVDAIEAGQNPDNPADTNGNGIPDFQEESVQNTGNDPSVDPAPDNDPSVDPAPDNDPSVDPAPDNDPSVDPAPDNDPRPDRDADGIANQDDLDDDNDGILDTEEGIVDDDADGVADSTSRDSDGDGTPDGNDLDSDNDGILDLVEGRFDASLVATLDPMRIGAIDIRIEVGTNGVADVIETTIDSGIIIVELIDTDGDGVFDYLDTDSDADGIGDLVEAGGADVDSDGRIDGFVDEDDKGVDDMVQISSLPLFDSDGDGVRDFRDEDSDNDGIPDLAETSGPLGAPTDSDFDGVADYREQDADNDGVPDAVEAGPDLNFPVDSDGDGVPDFQDPETVNGPGPTEPDPLDDHDADGQPDSIDVDDDNDGLIDNLEGDGDADSDGVINSLDRDSDNDGIVDSVELANDADGDGVPNYLDLDSDNDGIYDAIEAQRGNVASTGRLASGVADAFGLVAGASALIIDSDNDAIADPLDLDSDNDALTDVLESLGVDLDFDARLDQIADVNGDGADDSLESRSTTAADQDMDGIPNYLDLDSDQDGVADIVENYGSLADQDGDGRIDNFLSTGGNGLDDNYAVILGPLRDTDNDGLPDSMDIDSDGDGINDIVEAGGVDADDDGQRDDLLDSDGDGVPDVNDADITGGADVDGDSIDDAIDSSFVQGEDADGDGVVDVGDPDSNGDGFAEPLDDGSGPGQGQPVVLPDTNNNGIADINELDEPRTGFVETGLAGSTFGCSVMSAARAGAERRLDPTLVLLLGCSLLIAGVRRGGFR